MAPGEHHPLGRRTASFRICAVAVFALMFVGLAQPISAQNALVHKPAPPFVRKDLAGRTIDLRANRGKVVLLNFWATWCAPCQVELPRFSAWQKQYGASGLQVIAISMDDDAAPVRALTRKLRLGFPVVMGDDKLGTLYGGVLGLPVTFLISRDGTIVARIEGQTDLNALEQRIKGLLKQR
jgi:thiol-disulfide isomerase/thioredoxin